MEKYTTSKFLMLSKRLPLVRLLAHCQEELDFVEEISMNADGTEGTLVCPTMAAFRLLDRLWRGFVYAGLGYDRIVVAPRYRTAARTAAASRIALTISVSPTGDNRLGLLFKRH